MTRPPGRGRPRPTARARAAVRGRDLSGTLVGQVVAVNGMLADVLIDGGLITVPALGAAYSPGDVVRILRERHRLTCILGILGYAAPQAIPATDLSGVPGRHTAVPTSTGTYGASWITTHDDLVQGEHPGEGLLTGAAFYGDQLAGLGARPGSGYMTAAVRRIVAGGEIPGVGALTPTMRLLAQRRRPEGAPTLVGTATGPALAPGQTVPWPLPADWVTQLLDGTAGGLGIHVDTPTPFVRLAGQRTWAGSMAVNVEYRR